MNISNIIDVNELNIKNAIESTESIDIINKDKEDTYIQNQVDIKINELETNIIDIDEIINKVSKKIDKQVNINIDDILNEKVNNFTNLVENNIEQKVLQPVLQPVLQSVLQPVLQQTTILSNIPTLILPTITDNSIIEDKINNINNINNINILNDSINNFDRNINLEQINNRLNNIQVPKITFTNSSLNEIREFNTFNNDFTVNSNSNTDSEVSYTQSINNYKNNSLYIPKEFKTFKKLRNTPSQKKNNEIDEIDFVYNKLQDSVRYMTINRTNYIIIICNAIEIIENYKEIKTNLTKKEIITKAINRLITLDLDLCDFDKKIFVSTISNLIDLIINCTKTIYIKERYKHKHNHNYNNDNKDKLLTKNHLEDIVLAQSGQIIHSLIDKLTTIVIKKKYCLDKILVNMGTLTNILMILADKYIYLSGIEKKIIVLQAIDNFIKERLDYILEVDDHKKKELILVLDSIPISIDLFIALQKGKYKINKKNEIYKTMQVKQKFFCFKKKKLHSDENYEF
jgi:hypothetical protein